MRVGILATDGGPHSADKWAEISAGEIVDLVKIDPDRLQDSEADKTRKRSARKIRMYLEADILEALEAHHQGIMDLERSMLQETDKRLNHPLHPDSGAVDAAIGSVVGAAVKYGEPFASAFSDDGAKVLIHQIISRHFRSIMDIERSWHVDRQGVNLSDHARAWYVRRHGNQG